MNITGEFWDGCAECGKQFDALKQGKLRMAESFCSIECADIAYPGFSEAPRQ